MKGLALANLPVRFALELASLAAFAYWGWNATPRSVPRLLLAVGAPVSVAVFWGIFVSPKARIPTGHSGRAFLGLVVFLAAAWSLQARGESRLAAAFAGVAILSSVVSLAIRLPDG